MKDHLLKVLENSKNYTLEVAKAMPDQGYAQRPTSDTWSFGGLLNHIGYGIIWWKENYIENIETEWNPPELSLSKDDVCTYLEKSYVALKATLKNLDFDETEVKGFFSTLDHITHHRAQAVLHLRLQNIAPPIYRYE